MPFLENVHRAHLAELQRLTNTVTEPRLRRMYNHAMMDAQRDLRRRFRTVQGETFQAHHARMVMAQLHAAVHRLAPEAVTELQESARIVRAASLRSLLSDVGKMEEHFTGTSPRLALAEASRFWGVVDGRGDSLLRRHRTAVSNWSVEIIRQTERDLSSMLLRNLTVREMSDRVSERLGVGWWRGERIARTETAWAASSVAADGIRELHGEVPDLRMRWSEHVDDFTGQPMDDRVAPDSMVMHGQVAAPGGVFTMPRDDRVDARLWGLSWEFPPLRPNAREVLSPWRPSWGVPGWKYAGGMRVELQVSGSSVPSR